MRAAVVGLHPTACSPQHANPALRFVQRIPGADRFAAAESIGEINISEETSSMNAAKRPWSHIDPRKKGISQIAFCVLGGLLLTSFRAQAASVTVSFGQTAQNLTLTGRGPNASGLGTYFVTMGACTPTGGNTTCTFSGTFTSTAVGLTSGTFSLVTVYVGTGSTPLEGVQKSAGSDGFGFSSIPSTTTMTLTLVSSSETLVVPLFAGGQFVPGTAFNFAGIAGTQTCSGTAVPSCSPSQVGLVAGASITGPVTGGASFGNDYYLSHLAFSAGWQSTLTFVNYSPQQVTCTTNFYSDSGSPLPIPFSQGTISTRTDTMPPGGSVHDQTIASLAGSVAQQGWAQASCTGPVQLSLLFRFYSSGVATGEAGVNAETAPTTKFATFAQTATGVAYANPSTTQSATITITVYSSAGTQLGSTVITLGPLGHGAANLGPLLGLNFTGFVKITSTIPIISLSINAEAFPAFSALPPGDLAGSTVLVP
jgi:hypothetical protein